MVTIQQGFLVVTKAFTTVSTADRLLFEALLPFNKESTLHAIMTRFGTLE